MTRDEIDVLTRGMAPVIRSFVAKSLEPLQAALDAAKARIEELEQRLARAAETERQHEARIGELKQHHDARTTELDRLRAQVAEMEAIRSRTADLERRLAEQKPPRDGRDGRDADPAMLLGLVREQVAREMAQIPRPKDGKDGLSVADFSTRGSRKSGPWDRRPRGGSTFAKPVKIGLGGRLQAVIRAGRARWPSEAVSPPLPWRS